MKYSFITLFCITAFLISCEEMDYDPPNDAWNFADQNNDYWEVQYDEVYGYFFDFSSTNGNPCPNRGKNCAKAPNLQITIQARMNSFSSFKEYYENDDMEGYFESDPYWTEFFPNVDDTSAFVQNVINGNYKPYISQDSNIFFYDGPTLSGENVVLALFPNLNGPQY